MESGRSGEQGSWKGGVVWDNKLNGTHAKTCKVSHVQPCDTRSTCMPGLNYLSTDRSAQEYRKAVQQC
jgi:hypothetical protein